MLNLLVTEVQLNRPRILTGVRQVEAGRVAQHMRMNGEFVVSRLTRRCDYEMNRANQRTAAQ